MQKNYVLKNGFESGKESSRVSFCYQITIGAQGMDNGAVYAFMSAVSSEYNKILTQAVLNDMGQGGKE